MQVATTKIQKKNHRFERTSPNLLNAKCIFFDFSLTVKAAPHECVIRTGQPLA